MLGRMWRMGSAGGNGYVSANDFKVGVASRLRPHTTGDYDLTSSAMGSTTPKALYAVGDNGNDSNAYAADLQCSIGATDGTNQRVLNVMSDDAQAIANTARRSASDEIAQLCDNVGAVIHEENFKSFAAGKATLTVGADSISYTPHIGGLLMAGDDLSVAVGHVQLSTQNTEVDITGLGFEPDAVLFFGTVGTGGQFGDADDTSALVAMIGFAVNGSGGIEQCCYEAFDNNNVTTTVTKGTVRDNRCLAVVTASGLADTAECTAFGADGFSLTARDADGSSRYIGYMAIKVANGQFKTDVLDTPTSTGENKYSLDFRPKAVILVGTAFTAVNALETGDEGCIWCHSLLAETERSCSTYYSQHNVGTSNTASGYFTDSDIALAVRETDNSGYMYQADHVSFDDDGFTLNFGTVDATARKVLMLAIGG